MTNKAVALRTRDTEQFLDEHRIVPLVADFSRYNPAISALLVELGNKSKALPFYAIYPADGRAPIVFSDVPLTQANLLNYLAQAISVSAAQTAMAVER